MSEKLNQNNFGSCGAFQIPMLDVFKYSFPDCDVAGFEIREDEKNRGGYIIRLNLELPYKSTLTPREEYDFVISLIRRFSKTPTKQPKWLMSDNVKRLKDKIKRLKIANKKLMEDK